MIGPLLWLIYLLTYLNSERALHGSRQRFDVHEWFGVNMSFSDEDQILMENLYILKVMEQVINFWIKVGVTCG